MREPGRVVDQGTHEDLAVRCETTSACKLSPPRPIWGSRRSGRADPVDVTAVGDAVAARPALRRSVPWAGFSNAASSSASAGCWACSRAAPMRPCAGPAEEQRVAPRASWARLLHKIFEIDPRQCPKCQAEMKVVSVITDPAVIDRILAHIRETGGRDPFGERGPPEGKAVGVGAEAA